MRLESIFSLLSSLNSVNKRLGLKLIIDTNKSCHLTIAVKTRGVRPKIQWKVEEIEEKASIRNFINSKIVVSIVFFTLVSLPHNVVYALTRVRLDHGRKFVIKYILMHYLIVNANWLICKCSYNVE
jgi:hypothetical protein